MRASVPVPLAALLVLALPLRVEGQPVETLPARDRPLELARETRFQIGALEGAEWEMLSDVASVAFDAAGNLYVFDRGTGRLNVHAPDGSFVRTVLRRGDGPGEVSMPLAVAVSPDGTVAVVDMGRRVISRFGRDGSFQGSRPFDPVEDGVPSPPLLPHPDGGFVTLQSGLVMARGPGAGPPALPTTYPIRHLPGGEGPVRTLHEAWRPPREPGGGATVQLGGGGAMRFGGAMTPRAFDPTPSFGMLPDGRLVVADTVTWRLSVVGRDGGVERLLIRPIRPRAVTRRDREAERARRAEQIQGGGGPQVSIMAQGPSGPVQIDQAQVRQAMLDQLQEMEFAEEMPVLARIATDWEGRIWVGRRADDPEARGPVDVLSANGVYIGTIPASGMPLPQAFGPGGLAAFVERDELDVPRVRVERIRLNPR